MEICPECQEQMEIIGTEKFPVGNEKDNNFVFDSCWSKVMIVWCCKRCNVLFLREPKKVYG